MDLKEAVRKRKEFEEDLITKAMEDDNFRKELLASPKEVIEKETGKKIPEGLKVKVIEEEPNSVTIVLPRKPSKYETKEELSDDNLEKVAGGLHHIEDFYYPFKIMPIVPCIS